MCSVPGRIQHSWVHVAAQGHALLAGTTAAHLLRPGPCCRPVRDRQGSGAHQPGDMLAARGLLRRAAGAAAVCLAATRAAAEGVQACGGRCAALHRVHQRRRDVCHRCEVRLLVACREAVCRCCLLRRCRNAYWQESLLAAGRAWPVCAAPCMASSRAAVPGATALAFLADAPAAR
jgi:hypothetical protein